MSDVLDDYVAFLEHALPDDYDARIEELDADIEFRRRFHRVSYEAGWLMPDWEPALGGRELSAADALTVRIERARRRAPRNPNIQGEGVVAPALRRFATRDQYERLLVPLMRGDEWWALGMSEPEAGSDLGSLRSRAVERQDHFVLNGQKVWTTQADEARWAFVFARTDPAAAKHKGISCFAVELATDGITPVPIRMAAEGEESFCEVFFEDVRVPKDNLIGPLNAGWQVLMESLTAERDLIWIDNWLDIQHVLSRFDASQASGSQLARVGCLLTDAESIRFTGLRVVAERARGLPAPEAQTMKLLASESLQNATRVVLETAGIDGLLAPRPFGEIMKALPATIYGGTSEIQRDLIAERVLGMPRGR